VALFDGVKIFKKDYDIVYVHLHNPFIHVWFLVWSFLFKIDGSRLYGIYHSDLSNQGRLGDLYEFFFQKTSFIYDELIVSSPKLHQYSSVISKFQKVNIIPFPVKINNEYKVRNHFHGNIVAIGRLVPYKGFEFLIKAVSKTDLKLKIIGDGPLRTELEELSKSFSNITLCGNITDEDKDKIIAESDLLVVSSINKAEAYGMIIVEAFQSGLPVIASNIDTGVTFLVQDGVTGLVFDVLNEQSLISKLEELKEEKKMEKLSSGAYEFYLNNLTFSKFTENINRLRVSKN